MVILQLQFKLVCSSVGIIQKLCLDFFNGHNKKVGKQNDLQLLHFTKHHTILSTF